MNNLYIIMHVDIGEGSSYEPSVLAVVQGDYESARHVVDLKHDELAAIFSENYPDRKLDVDCSHGTIRAIDECGEYGWVICIQKVLMDSSFTVLKN